MLIKNDVLAGLVGSPPEGYEELRKGIVSDIQSHRLIRAVMAGNRRATVAWMSGFSHYVASIGPEIGCRAAAYQPDVARAFGSDENVALVEAHQDAMRRAEGSHIELWVELAKSLGVPLPPTRPPGRAMERLLHIMRAYDNGGFYAALAAIETIAWALAELAFRSPIHDGCASGWFDVHLWRHEPTHEEIYRWMAIRIHKVNRASSPETRFITDARGTVDQFIAVADELLEAHTPAMA